MAQKKATAKKMLTVRQTRSAARKPKEQEATLRGLGLGKIRRTRRLEDTPAVRGMIRAVQHLVEIVEEGKHAKTWNRDAAKTVGTMIAERALAKGVKQVVFDRGGYIYHGRVKALAEAAREGGLEF